MLFRFEIDDPLDISQTHGICGFWALIASGIFDRDRGFLMTGNGEYLGIQFLGALSIALWSGIIGFIFFFVLKKMGRLRINGLYEVIGVDFMIHGMQDTLS